jgi:hypothetical protein
VDVNFLREGRGTALTNAVSSREPPNVDGIVPSILMSTLGSKWLLLLYCFSLRVCRSRKTASRRHEPTDIQKVRSRLRFGAPRAIPI